MKEREMTKGTEINISINPITGDVEMKRMGDAMKAIAHRSPMLADNAGFPVGDMAQAYEDHACRLGKSGASELTDEEKTQAFAGRVCTARQVADVVQLDAHRLAPDPYVVEAVRTLLDLAESGELQALQWAGALSKGRTRVATVGQWGDVIQMLGASTMLKMHVEAMAMESMEEI